MYHVDWLPSAERELTELWTNGPDRSAIAAAADKLDDALAKDALDVGEARAGITRIGFETPLAILFDVDVEVRVWDVWRWPA